MRLRSLLALAFALVAIVVSLCGSLAAQHLTTKRLEAHDGREMTHVARQVRNLLDRSMYNRWRDVSILATVARTTATSADGRRAWIEAMQQTFPDYAWIGFASPDGTVTASTHRILEGASVAARPWFQGGLKASYAGDLHEAALLARKLPDPLDGSPWRFVDLSAPVLDADGHVEAVVGAHLSWSWADTLTHSVLDPVVAQTPGTDVLVLDVDGKVLLGPPQLMGSSVATSSKVWRTAVSGDSYALETWPDGTTYLIGASHTVGLREYPGLGWTVLVRRDAQVAFSSARQVGTELLLGGLLVACVAALLGWLTSWRICRPLLILADAAERLERAPGASRLPEVGGAEELQRLSKALNGMLAAIVARDRSLAETNQTLERRVEKRTRALEAASRAKSRFLAGMSHELRTPLNGILGYTQLLRLEGGLTPTQTSRVEAMLGAGQHLLDMINGVLDLSSVEAERLELRPVLLNPAEITHECLELVRPAAEAKSLAVSLLEQPGAPRRVVADATRLRQIMLNLLGNAVKFTRKGSVKVTLEPYGADAFRVVVTDTGPGIPSDRRASLFQDFERLGADSADVEGAGLGLALSSRLATLMGGAVGHENNPEGGSVFWLQLPRGDQQKAEAAPVATSAHGLKLPGLAGAAIFAEQPAQLNVLVVDDLSINRDIAGAFLRSVGHTCTCVETGAEAVAAASAGGFDAILMDVRMPGMDGLEATRRIRSLPAPHGRVPVVALTAQVFAEQITECREAGMDGHLAKPFNLQALAAALDLAVATAKRRPPVAPAAATPARAAPAPAAPPLSAPTVPTALVAPAEQATPKAPAEPQGGPGSMPLIDESAFSQMTQLLSADTLAAHLAVLQTRGKALLAELAGVADGVAVEVEVMDAAHTLAGSSAMFGFDCLADAARQFERMSEADAPGRLAAARSLAGAIEAAVAEMGRRQPRLATVS